MAASLPEYELRPAAEAVLGCASDPVARGRRLTPLTVQVFREVPFSRGIQGILFGILQQPSRRINMTRYAAYLRLEGLLSLQAPITARTATELTFIIGHQVYELWFKLIIVRLRRAVTAMDGDAVLAATEEMRHVNEIERLMFDQLVLLERLDPGDFAEVRGELGNASGAESEQFFRIEQLSRCRGRGSDNGERDVWSAFGDLFGRQWSKLVGAQICSGGEMTDPHRIAEIYASDDPDAKLLCELAERMLDHDQGIMTWRFRHRFTAERHIGVGPGTGGTSGVDFLTKRIGEYFYPELWQARGLVGADDQA